MMAASVAPGQLVTAAVLGVAVIVGLIVVAKLHPFLSLIIGSVVVAGVAGFAPSEIVESFSGGFGSTLGGVGVLIALGAVIGRFLVSSGGADAIVEAFLRHTPQKARPWAMAALAFLMGIPLFFEVGIVLLIPVVMLVARRSKTPAILLGIPALAGLSALHALVPPHPGPLLAIDTLGADLGLTLGLGLLVALPVVAISGPLVAPIMARWVPVKGVISGDAEVAPHDRRPGFAASFAVIILPVVLMLSRTVVETLGVQPGTAVFIVFDVLGEPVVALLITTFVAIVVLGYARGIDRGSISDTVGAAFGPIAGVLLIVGAGGGFKQILVDTSVADVVGEFIHGAAIPPLMAAWLVAALIRVATGSATVATITAAGIMAPVFAGAPDPEVALAVLAIGAGSVFLSHVNDAGFWLVKEYFGMSVPQTFKTWSLMESLLSLTGLAIVMALSVPLT